MAMATMSHNLDTIPLPGIIRIRDMMFGMEHPFRLDQGEVSFETPGAIKSAMKQALDANHTHYVQTTGLPRLRELLVDKLRRTNGIAVNDPSEIFVTAGGMHALYVISHALLEPGDEIILPDPVWPATYGHILTTRAVPVACPLHESLGWRYDLDELASKITGRTRAILLNTPHNPTGGVLTRHELECIAELAEQHDLWIISDEAYEDIVYDETEHVSIASLPDIYARTIPVYTFSKSFAMTGLRLGYLAICSPIVQERVSKLISYTASNVSSLIQWGGIGGLEASPAWVDAFRVELQARRDLFYTGVQRLGGLLTGEPPKGAFYAFLRIDEGWQPAGGLRPGASRSWALAEWLMRQAKVGCVPGVDFGSRGEGYIRFAFSRERAELEGALDAIRALLES